MEVNIPSEIYAHNHSEGEIDALLIKLKKELLTDTIFKKIKRQVEYILDPDIVASWWSVEDFEARASDNEDGGEKIYDRSKFTEALKLMVEEEDANIGINWETIDCYLDKYCSAVKG